MAKDPLPKAVAYLLDNEIVTEEELKKIDEEILKEIAAAVKFAEDSPVPSLESIVQDIYTDIVEEVR
jgi:pyruvate dehydrogenase E1 component alpha subunit